jgi:RsiW-degrading membrane proteinase PrsW (M82 family)
VVRIKPGTARNFAKHVVPHVVKPARIIWNQLIGALFLVFAIPAFYRAYTFYKTLDSEPQSAGQLVITLIFGIIMAAFGLTSLLRARRISRS